MAIFKVGDLITDQHQPSEFKRYRVVLEIVEDDYYLYCWIVYPKEPRMNNTRITGMSIKYVNETYKLVM